MKFIKNWFLSLLVIGSIAGVSFTTVSPLSVHAADSASCSDSFLGFPAWYRGLLNAQCEVSSPSEGELSKFIWTIIANIIDIGFHLAIYVAIFFILLGGFNFITGNGSSDRITKAKNMILNAVIGLIISIVASAAVNLILGIIK